MSSIRFPRPATGVLAAMLAGVVIYARAEQRTPYTETELESAVPMGIPGVRAWADAPLSVLRKQVERLAALGSGRPISILALSGGGEHGAFGAGLLNGWSESGRRPRFDIVTGVSTGALMAPSLFLDLPMISASKRSTRKCHFIAFSQAILSWGYLVQVCIVLGRFSKSLPGKSNEKMLADVAAAHRQGRRLFVVTTNLDAQRPVLWNMGAIATSGRPEAIELFRKVLVASASVPGVFDPVFIDAEANGHRFKEMHVDGGTAYPLFAVPLKLLAATGQVATRRGGQLYIVINNNLDPEFAMTKPKTLSIMARAFNTLVKSDFYDTILGAYLFAGEKGVRFNLAYIPNSFHTRSVGLIDPKYMITLFEFGRAQGRLGGDWEHTPPRLYR